MNDDVFRLVQQSVEAHSMTDDERLLEALRITRDKELPPMHFLFRIFGKPCFPRGELVAVTGKAKSGKTLFNSMLMAGCGLTPDPSPKREGEAYGGEGRSGCYSLPFLQRVMEDPPRVLWYDTEQSEQSTQDILKNRLLRMIGLTPDPSPKREGGVKGEGGLREGSLREKSYKIDTKSNEELDDFNSDFDRFLGEADTPEQHFDVFNVRSLHWEERMRLFRTAVRKYRPQLVVLDGVRDLLADINDGIRAQEVVEELMKLAQETDCCMVCVLHQNKGAEDRNPRGWIGTELMNKAFEVYACEKLKPENIFMVEQTHTRKYDLGELMFFRMDPETELPVACEAPARLGVAPAIAAGQQGAPLPHMNREYLEFDENNRPHPKMDELFYEVLKAGPLYYNEMQTRVIGLLNCGTPMWNYMFNTMRNRGAIVRVINCERKAVWQLQSADSATTPSLQPDLFDLPPDSRA